jgi:hypothetical protein
MLAYRTLIATGGNWRKERGMKKPLEETVRDGTDIKFV